MSADGYTPTEDQVRMAYGDARCVDPDDPAHSRGCPQDEEFDRWLAAHDAEVARAAKAEALEEFAMRADDDWGEFAYMDETGLIGYATVPEMARERAAEYRKVA